MPLWRGQTQRPRPQLSRYELAANLAGGYRSRMNTDNHRIYATSVASVYPLYVKKAEKKGRTKAEVDEIIRWLTGHSQQSLDQELKNKTSFEDFFAAAPKLNPQRSLITGVVCGVKVQEIK